MQVHLECSEGGRYPGEEVPGVEVDHVVGGGEGEVLHGEGGEAGGGGEQLLGGRQVGRVAGLAGGRWGQVR